MIQLNFHVVKATHDKFCALTFPILDNEEFSSAPVLTLTMHFFHSLPKTKLTWADVFKRSVIYL